MSWIAAAPGGLAAEFILMGAAGLYQREALGRRAAGAVAAVSPVAAAGAVFMDPLPAAGLGALCLAVGSAFLVYKLYRGSGRADR
jgi:hypothetical protein